MDERYTVNDVLHFLDADLSGEEDSDDDFDGYVDEVDDSEEDENDDLEMETDASEAHREGNSFYYNHEGLQ